MESPTAETPDKETQTASAEEKIDNKETVEQKEDIEEEEFPDECSLFVGDISRSLSEEQLKDTFMKYGTVVSVEIKRDRVTNYSLGYAFVQMKSRKEASLAKRNLHKTVIGNRAIRIGWAQKNTNIFVGDLDPSVTTEQLRETFRVFGPIYEEETFVKHKNYGFVKFKHRSHAERAKQEMDGKILGGRPIRIGWGDANTQRYCVHIQFSSELAESYLTEGDVREAFDAFGEIISINLPRTYSGEYKGFGFIHYEDSDAGEESAARAIKHLNGSQICGITIQCNFGKKQHPRTKPFFKKRQQFNNVYQYPAMMMPMGSHGSWQPFQYLVSPTGQYYLPARGGNDAAYMYNSQQQQHQPMYQGYYPAYSQQTAYPPNPAVAAAGGMSPHAAAYQQQQAYMAGAHAHMQQHGGHHLQQQQHVTGGGGSTSPGGGGGGGGAVNPAAVAMSVSGMSMSQAAAQGVVPPSMLGASPPGPSPMQQASGAPLLQHHHPRVSPVGVPHAAHSQPHGSHPTQAPPSSSNPPPQQQQPQQLPARG